MGKRSQYVWDGGNYVYAKVVEEFYTRKFEAIRGEL